MTAARCTVTGCAEPAELVLDVLDVPRDYCRPHWGDAVRWLLTGEGVDR